MELCECPRGEDGRQVGHDQFESFWCGFWYFQLWLCGSRTIRGNGGRRNDNGIDGSQDGTEDIDGWDIALRLLQCH